MKNFFKRIFPLLFIITLLFFGFRSVTFAITQEDCENKIGKGQLNASEAEDCSLILENILAQKGEEKRSLQGEITKFNTAIALTATQIVSTIGQIETLEKEIAALTAKIGRLDLSLDQISEILIKRVGATYKKGKADPLTILLSSKDFSDFVSRYKYLRVMQIHDRNLMVQMENVRTNFEDQKTLKEEKQDELGKAQKKLEAKKVLFDQQKKDKENLLKQTQGSEQRYQQLLTKARAEVASLKGFTQKQGGGILPPQNSPDGWYYSQRDERWANMLIGYSSENIMDVGCLVSSVAMIFTYYGQKTTPADIAGNSSYFFARTAYMNSPWPTPSGKSQTSLSNMSEVDKELEAGRPVVVHLNLGGDGHFVVLKKKDGGDYIMHDPWQGYDKKLNDFYSVSVIDKRVVYR